MILCVYPLNTYFGIVSTIFLFGAESCWTRCVAQVADALIVLVVKGAGRACVTKFCCRVPSRVEWLFITYVKGTFFGMSESGEASKRR
jgi:hypothetical protein